ncbi:MAG: ferritin-like domain-containing protein [Gammaproteobacteria bacterium]|nr:ferritin-like domain-containing protein [Gammaproteobacteria bacterium]
MNFLPVREALLQADGASKCAAMQALKRAWDAGELDQDGDSAIDVVDQPGRPERPLLVSPRDVERRQVSTLEGRAALIHSIAHIEFNAINLALDAIYRFRGLPRAYYGDWLQVAAEEAYHFTLLRDHLRSLGFDYGDFSAHNGLWQMALQTAHDPLVRMALVPRVLEARGLDVSPTLINKFKSCGDRRAVEILEIIQRDEIGHVRIGNRWYHYLCEQRALDPLETFRRLLVEYNAPRLRPPFAEAARRQAGFSDDEMALLEMLATKT